jgi:thiol:disulfide interchange protein
MFESEVVSYFWMAFGFGALSLLTPCVFPLIPITISFFLKKDEKDTMNPWLKGFLYSSGIVLSFGFLGLVVSFFFGAGSVSKLASNPILNVLIGILFIVFSLNLWGLFEIRLPYFLVNYLSNKSEKAGLLSIFIMAFTFTLTTFTCTMPFLGTVLVSASKGEWFFPLIGMMGYSIAFAIPFFFLSVFPGLLSGLPKSGNWMVKVKIVLGFIELMASLKFFSNADLVWNTQILSRDNFLFIWISILFTLLIYLLGIIEFPHESKKEIKMHPFSVLFFISLSFSLLYLTKGVGGKPLGELDAFLPPEELRIISKESNNEYEWMNNIEEAKKKSEIDGRLIFIDFTGYSCVNCRWMEQNMFTLDPVRNKLSSYHLVRLYTDGEGEEFDKNMEYQEQKFGSIALPYYALIDKDENILGSFMGMTREKEEFLDFLYLKNKNR